MFDIKLAVSIMFGHALLHYGAGKRRSYIFGGSIYWGHLSGGQFSKICAFVTQILLDTGLCVTARLKAIDP